MLGGSTAWTAPSIQLFHPYDFVDGSASHFGGFVLGDARRHPSGVTLGAESDLAFGAEPPTGTGGPSESVEAFGTARGRIGYVMRRWITSSS